MHPDTMERARIRYDLLARESEIRTCTFGSARSNWMKAEGREFV